MTQKDWYKIAGLFGLLAILIVAMLASMIYLPAEEDSSVEDRLVQAEAALEECRSELGECQSQFEDCSAELVECLAPPPSPPSQPTLEVEKWVKISGSCCWLKEISARKGDWLEFRLLVTVTGTLSNVRVKDPTLTGDPWVRIQGLSVDNVPTGGNIVSGLTLGTMTNETKEISFRVLLCSQDGQYDCGTNVLTNTAEVVADCGYRTTSSVSVKVEIACSPRPPSCRTVPPTDEQDPDPDQECPEVIRPPGPPEPEGPADRPSGDEEPSSAPPQEEENDSSPDSSGEEEGPADRPDE